MMALEQTENMQRNCEASLKCLHSKGFPYNLQCNGNPIEGFPEHKDELSNHPGGDNSESDRPLGSEFLEPPTECHNKPTYHHDFGYWSAFHFDSQKLQQCQMNAFESQFYQLPVDNRFHYVPFNVFAQSYPNEFQFQDFQYFVVIDFEATCDKDRNPHPQEIIEFPSVIVSSVTGQLEACFQTYVRPTCNHLLSDFCKDLTGIQQIQASRIYGRSCCGCMADLMQLCLKMSRLSEESTAVGKGLKVSTGEEGIWRSARSVENLMGHLASTGYLFSKVDRGVTLSEALLRHDKWLEKKGIKNTNFAVVTWSNWDCRVMLESECRFKKIRKPPYFNRWINLKVPFREVFGGMRCNLKEAVQMAGLAWQGRAHCGLDDAKNTARLLSVLMRRGFKFAITNSLLWQTADRPLTLKQSPEHLSPPHHTLKLKDMSIPVCQYHHPFCFCGVKSSRGMVRKPGPKQGSVFFGCGNWTATRGARCHYFEWASA